VKGHRPAQALFVAILLALFAVACECKPQGVTKKSSVTRIGLSMDTLKEERWQHDRDLFVARAKVLGGIIYTARVGSASPDAGRLLELNVIAACVIGGTSLMGGRGTIFGAVLGAVFMESLNNGMSLKNFEDFTQDIVKGVILVAAGLDMLGRKRG
jgi:hypothetical protein